MVDGGRLSGGDIGRLPIRVAVMVSSGTLLGSNQGYLKVENIEITTLGVVRLCVDRYARPNDFSVFDLIPRFCPVDWSYF